MIHRLHSLLTLLPPRAIRSLLCDAGFLAGIGIVGYGIMQWSQTAAIVYAGLALAGVSFLNSPPDEPTQ